MSTGTMRVTSLHNSPAVGFDQPFEMLTACHERVQRMLALLQRLAEHLVGHGPDDQAAQAAHDVMRYFDLAGPAHHLDEELHLLPWLAAHGHAELAERLHQEHGHMAAAWADVRAGLLAVVAGEWPLAGDDSTVERWAAFAALYREHIEAEESVAYPAAEAAFDEERLAAMGREMAARRGQTRP